MRSVNISDCADAYDVVVVGAGPAGCILVRNLDPKLKVLLIDRNAQPRSKPCGGMLVEESQAIISSLNPPSNVFSSPKEYQIEYEDWDNQTKGLRPGKLWNVSRERFDWWLFNLAEESNADFCEEARVTEVKEKHGKNVVTIESGGQKEVTAKIVVGADGSGGLVRRKTGGPPLTLYLAMQERMEPKNDLKNPLFIFGSKYSDWYGWVIPKRTSTVVGLAVPFGAKSQQAFDAFRTECEKKYGLNRLGNAFEAHVLSRPASGKEVCLGKNHALLVGEAAGLLSPTYGEGISFALRSGMLAAKAINEKLDNPLPGYQKLAEPLAREIAEKAVKAKALSDPKKRKELLA